MQSTTLSGGGTTSRTIDGGKLLGREVLHPHLDIVRRHAGLKQFNSEHCRCRAVCEVSSLQRWGSKSRLEAMLKPPLRGGQ
jgi:hypothetical protein